MEVVAAVVGYRCTFLAFERESNFAAGTGTGFVAIVAITTAVVVASFATAHIAATIAANTAATIAAIIAATAITMAITARYLGVFHSKDPLSLLPHPLEVFMCHS